MVRPKRNLDEKNAVERIDDAFWKALEEGRYEDITIKSLSYDAKVNRNTIYYYYENVDDVARNAFKRFVSNGVSEFIISLVFEPDIKAVKDKSMAIQAWKKIRLLAKGDSAFLANLYKENLIHSWCDKFNIDLKHISFEDQITLNFIFSGFIAIIGNLHDQEEPFAIVDILKTEVGSGAAASLQRIAAHYGNR